MQLKNKAEAHFVSTAAASEEPSGGLLKQVAQRLVIEVTVSTFKKTLVLISGCNTTYYPLKPAQVGCLTRLYLWAHTGTHTHMHAYTHTHTHTHTNMYQLA